MTILSDIDWAVLLHARVFPPTVYDPPRCISTVMSVGSVSETQERDSVRRLTEFGLLVPRGEPSVYGKDRGRVTAQHYRITDRGLAAARAHEGTPELTVALARPLHASDLRTIYGDLPLAQRQLELREQGAALVRGALQALGYEFRGTGGWHITAYVTPELRLGLVNIAHGVAAVTSVALSAEMVEALTVPEQPAGVLASGAAAWTVPDAGEGHRAGAPAGWQQLLVDIRQGVSGALPTPALEVQAQIVQWGLLTCYGYAGAPGYRQLDGDATARMAIQEWPADEDTRRAIRGIGARWLDALSRQVAALAGCAEEVSAALDRLPSGGRPGFASAGPDELRLPTEADLEGAIGATGVYAWHPHHYDAAGCARTCCDSTTEVIREALAGCGVARISSACDVSNVAGLRYYDLLSGVLHRAIVQRLTPVAEVFWAQTAPLVGGREDGWDVYMRLQPVLRGFAVELARDLLRGVSDQASETEARIERAYYARGPVSVAVALESRTATAA